MPPSSRATSPLPLTLIHFALPQLTPFLLGPPDKAPTHTPPAPSRAWGGLG